MKKLPYILIVGALIIGAGIYLEATKDSSTAITKQMLESGDSDVDVEFKNYGKAPEFTGLGTWLNSEPLKLSELRGKVVLVDFWTYSCINCVRTLPYLTHWDETYRDKGLVVIGIHTPEFGFEAVTKNVETALKRHNIKYPVAQDNDYMTWNAFSNRYWPAKYLIDQNGDIVYTHFGEGNYEETETAIQKLLGVSSTIDTSPEQKTGKVGSPEMYFGFNRLEYLESPQRPQKDTQKYTFPSKLGLNSFALDGTWKLEAEKAVLTSDFGRIKLKFNAGKVYMVANGTNNAKRTFMEVKVDGVVVQTIAIDSSMLYKLFESNDYREHELELYIDTPGFEAFTFTFG